MPRTQYQREQRISRQSEYGTQRNKFFWARKAIHTMSITEVQDALQCMERMYRGINPIPNPRYAVCYRQWQKLRAAELGSTVEDVFGDSPSPAPVVDSFVIEESSADIVDGWVRLDDNSVAR
jgi:hypothetical protein